MFIDTHCHPYLANAKLSQENYQNFLEKGGKKLIAIGVDYETSLLCIKEAKENAFISASIGVHPCYVGFDRESLEYFLEILRTKKDLKELVGIFKDLYKNHQEKIVAIGECGLDYHHLESISKKLGVSEEQVKELQKYYFKAQIELARELDLPFIIHSRNSGDDLWDILCECGYDNFVLHSFCENLEYAQKCLENFPKSMISFSGIVSFKNAKDIQEVARLIPLDRILIETDSPYLTPTPLRGKEENEPAFTQYVLDAIIELRTESHETVTKQIYNNSLKFFSLDHD